MLSVEQEQRYYSVMRRFVKIHTEGKWRKLYRYSIKLNLQEAEIARLMNMDRAIIRYWLDEINSQQP